MWPYSYSACDVGTLPNQTNPDGMTPAAAKTMGDVSSVSIAHRTGANGLLTILMSFADTVERSAMFVRFSISSFATLT